MMTMPPDELRQLRSWAVNTVLQKHALSDAPVSLDIDTVIAEARKLVSFVRSNP
jgi:hypothetical protein